MFRPTLAVLGAAALAVPALHAASQMEYLDRGLVAVRLDSSRVLLSWRLLGTDPADTTFHVYRGAPGEPLQPITTVPLSGPTLFTDDSADLSRANTYAIRPIHGGVGQALSPSFTLPGDSPQQSHFSLPLDRPADVPDDGTVGTHSYSAGDCSVADLDGDGQLEMLVKWDPSNAKDNSQSGHTGKVLIDAYELDGTRLWRLDLGHNIRAGAHYTQFIVYDFDGDGRAELACRTAPGATDAQGDFVADPAKWQNAGGPVRPTFSHNDDYRNSGGWVLEGPEFLTFFDGLSGDELVSTSFIPFRDPDNNLHSPGTTRIDQVWGDGYGNRIDRFLAGTAYLDGERPSLIMTRGYYTRSILVAWDWRAGTLSRRWVFDSATPGNGAWAGQGAHSLAVGDTDGDGRDEIVFGSCAIDDDGSGLWSQQLGTGDALHLSDMDPTEPGLECWMVHESPSTYGVHGSVFSNAATGSILYSVDSADDIGRGVAADIDPRTLGFEAWSSRANLHDADGNEILSGRPGPMNFLSWWDGDLTRELLDGTTISKWDWNSAGTSTLLSPAGVSSNNGTKATPALSADLFGDWREEVVWRESDSSALRIYTSTLPTDHRLPTLMHDRQYRQAIAWQNVGYNQPPHPGYYLGAGMAPVPLPALDVVLPPGAPVPTADRFPDWLAARGLDPATDPEADPDGNGMSFFGEYAFDLPNQTALAIRHEDDHLHLDLAAVRDELDYLVERTTDFSEWTEVLTLSGTGGGRVEIPVTPGETREFFRATAISSYPVTSSSVTLQAEDTAFSGFLESNHSGFNGSGFINFDTSGSFIEWTGIDGGGDGTATLSFRYAYGNADTRTGLLIINGVAQPITFSGTGAWNSWAELEVAVSLNPGATNTIRLESNGEDLANIDEMTVTTTVLGEPEASVTLNLPIFDPYETTDLFIIGDSTVANYGSSYAPWKGWGQLFQTFLDPARFTVHNRALGGRSSKSFIVEGLWDGVKGELGLGDFLLIEWGHNDRDWTKPERYTTETEYKGYLAQYITEARTLGAVPVFVTPMVMNAWNGSTMRNVFTEAGNDYAGWMKQVAADLDVPLIDLNQKSWDYFSVLDYDTAGRYFYNTYVAGEYPNYPSGNTDGTHFQEMGALMMGKFVAEGFREIESDPRVSALAAGLKPQHPIAIQANLPAAGRVSLSTELPEGANFHLKALVDSGHSFLNWKDGADQLVTNDSLTTFTVGTSGQQFTAYFDNETPVAPPAPGSLIPGGEPFDFTVTLSAEAFDPDSEIDLVEYFDADTDLKLGEATSEPWTFVWTITSGVHRVYAESTSKLGIKTRSAVMAIDTGAPNTPPGATLTSPADSSTFDAGDDLTLTAVASDADGIVTRVVFERNGSHLGEDDTAPYTFEWTDIPGGSHTLGAYAIDDRGALSPVSTAAISVNFNTAGELLQEAEAGTLAGSFTVVADAAASGGQAVEAVSGPADTNYVEFTFDVPTAGDYLLRGRIKAIDGNHDSMFVSIDGGPVDEYLWDTARSTGYVDDYVFNRGGPDPAILTLTAGTHTIRFGYRENLFLDQVELEPAP